MTASTVAQYLAALRADRRAALSAVVGRTVARVSAEKHMANYQAARALLGKGKNNVKKDASKSAEKKSKPKK